LIFISTVLYYAYPYIRRDSGKATDPRTNWYRNNYNLMRWNQVIITAILIISAIIFLGSYPNMIMRMTFVSWLLLLIFPVVAASYYGISFLSQQYNIRKIGWLKPFIIGFTWAGLVTIYPVLFYVIINNMDYQFTWVGILLFVKNLMFIAVLCIMFDIKDYASDCLCSLKTFVVTLGLRRTIFNILFPLSTIGLMSFVWYTSAHQFPTIRIILNVIPFILLGIVAYSLRRRRSLLYYLSVVDGLMLAKAACGAIAIKYF